MSGCFTLRLSAVLALVTTALATSGFDIVVAQRQQGTALRRTSDGQPDMQGIWNSTAGGASVSVERVPDPAKTGGMGSNTTIIVDPPDGRIPYQPWAREKKEAIFKTFLNPTLDTLDPQVFGWPSGIPGRTTYRDPFRSCRRAGRSSSSTKTTTSSARDPAGRPSAARFQDQAVDGQFEGPVGGSHAGRRRREQPRDSLALDRRRFSHRRIACHRALDDGGTGQNQGTTATLTDPNMYTRPWTIAFALTRDTLPGNELMEFAAVEDERWVPDSLIKLDSK